MRIAPSCCLESPRRGGMFDASQGRYAPVAPGSERGLWRPVSYRGRDKIAFETGGRADDRLQRQGSVITANWVEAEQLFGCHARQFNGELSPATGSGTSRKPGGVLIISLRTLLSQPTLLWDAPENDCDLKQRFDWVGYDESRPLLVSVPSMPLSLIVVPTGDRRNRWLTSRNGAELAELQRFTANTKTTSRWPMLMTWHSGGVSGCCGRCGTLYIYQCLPPRRPGFDPLAVIYTGDRETPLPVHSG